MTKISSAIFKTFFLSLCIVANTHFAFAQTASILPQGYTQYLDSNGKPLSAGKVYNYIPSTTTFKTTWQDAAETIPNTNPVTLDAAGRAKILGDGSYRQIVKDRNGVTIWDAVTSSTGSGSSSPVATGDGDLVGTIKPWAGMTAPNQYAFTYGQEVSRTTYSALYTAITSSQSVFCNSGSPTLNGLTDTTNFWIGMSVEVSCVAAGFSTIVSKTSSTVVLAANANATTNTTAIFYPWGRGNGTTTFNLPDLRGVIPAGNNNMGGVASANLTTTYFGATNPNSAGALGGSQSKTLIASDIPSITPTGTVSTVISSGTNILQTSVGGATGGGTGVVANNTTTITASSTFSGIPQGGGIAVSAVVAAAGSGYTPGSQTITVSGGTCTTQPQFTVTVSGDGAFSGTPSLLTAGSCTVAPTNPAATTGGGGTGGTLTVTYSSQPFSLIQPTRTTNFIIKITPDTNSASASGVTSLGGMTGDIACGTGLSCTGNNVSVTSVPLIVGSTVINSGTNTRVLYDNSGSLGEYSISGSGSVAMTTSPTFSTSVIVNGTETVSSTSATALSVGANGATNPALSVDASVASSATGWKITSNAAGAANGAQLTVISSGTNEIGRINAKGNALLYLNDTGTGGISIGAGGGGVFLQSASSVTSASANAFAVGLNGTTNPAFNVDASTASSATGLNIKSAAAAGGLAVSVLSSGTNENLTINAKGSGTISIGNTSTGAIALGGGGGAVTANGNTVAVTIASGTSALGTGAIASGACASAVTTAATGVATTDVIDFGFNGDPTATTGYTPPNMLAIAAYPSANNVNFRVCNNTAGSITPSAVTLNWKVRR